MIFTDLHFVAHARANEQNSAAVIFLPGVAQLPFKPTNHAVTRIEFMLPLLLTLCRLAQQGALIVLILLLSGCAAVGQPPRQALLQALNLQVQLSQSELAAALQVSPRDSDPSLQRVRLDQQSIEKVESHRVWLLRGRFDWRWPGEPLNVSNPFEVRLLRGEKGQTWRLLRPPTPELPQWSSYPLS